MTENSALSVVGSLKPCPAPPDIPDIEICHRDKPVRHSADTNVFVNHSDSELVCVRLFGGHVFEIDAKQALCVDPVRMFKFAADGLRMHSPMSVKRNFIEARGKHFLDSGSDSVPAKG